MSIIDKEPSVCILTPTTGSFKLATALESVRIQNWVNLTHLLVVDGPEYEKPTEDLLLTVSTSTHKIKTVVLPENTGANGFYGHRIYAAFPHLLNSDVIFFLDQDCQFDAKHVSSLVRIIQEKKLDWAYSLRMIYDPKTIELIPDNCESLGKWDIYCHQGVRLVDTSSFAFTLPFIQKTCHLWHSGWGGDRRYLGIITTVLKHTNFDTTGDHTCVYALDGNPNSPTMNFFKNGNSAMAHLYPGVFPWHQNRGKYTR